MKKRAKFLFSMDHGKALVYEYRGRQYSVCPMLFTSTADQHRMEQRRIDGEIEKEAEASKREAERGYRYEDTAEYGFEVFWKYVTGEGDGE